MAKLCICLSLSGPVERQEECQNFRGKWPLGINWSNSLFSIFPGKWQRGPPGRYPAAWNWWPDEAARFPLRKLSWNILALTRSPRVPCCSLLVTAQGCIPETQASKLPVHLAPEQPRRCRSLMPGQPAEAERQLPSQHGLPPGLPYERKTILHCHI